MLLGDGTTWAIGGLASCWGQDRLGELGCAGVAALCGFASAVAGQLLPRTSGAVPVGRGLFSSFCTNLPSQELTRGADGVLKYGGTGVKFLSIDLPRYAIAVYVPGASGVRGARDLRNYLTWGGNALSVIFAFARAVLPHEHAGAR